LKKELSLVDKTMPLTESSPEESVKISPGKEKGRKEEKK
jgi:hypothetical protein